MLKKLFYASASILMLALAYHLGATTAGAQAPGNPVVAAIPGGGLAAGGEYHVTVFTANGDVYAAYDVTHPPWVLLGNIFSGSTPAQQQTWGQLKVQYRK